MKKLSLFILLALVTMFSCENDETRAILNSDSAPAVITSTEAELSTVITGESLANLMTIEWDKTPYGVSTEVDYTVQIDSKCGGFESPIVLGATTNASFSISLDNLNAKLLNDLKLAQAIPAELEIRVTSTINNNYLKTSSPVSFTVTPYSAKSKSLWLTSTAWTLTNAPSIQATGTSTYEGYTYLNGDASFNLVTSRGCENISFGGAEGTLATDGAAISTGANGYYKINVDTEANTYQLTPIQTWGMIGTSTPGAWGTSSPLTFNKDKGVWEGKIDLVPGALKFRANNGWDLNYGPANIDNLTGSLIPTNDAINITKAANYLVTLDFSQSKAPYSYAYTVVESGLVAALTKLWLPGGYQDYKPDLAPYIYSVSEFVYDGYVKISSATGYKFTSAPDWNHTNYGDGGTAGVLSTDGTASDLSLGAGGYYNFRVDVKNLTYKATLVNSLGIIGTATPGSWDNSTAMTYDAGNDVWTVIVDLIPGALKFRANNDWGVNYGPADPNKLTGELKFDDQGSISITDAGNYTITIDMSRADEPHIYSYVVTKN